MATETKSSPAGRGTEVAEGKLSALGKLPTLRTEVKEITVAIIGSAGRTGEMKKVSKKLFDLMVADAHKTITEKLKLDPKMVTLVSGGAAFGDHVAVVLYLTRGYGKLNLFLPSGWSSTKTPSVTGGTGGGVTGFVGTEDGKRAQELHQQFAQVLNCDTLAEIELARVKGASLIARRGFFERNSDVAKSFHMLAYTFSTTGSPPTTGSGTRNTWDKWEKQVASKRGQRIHTSLSSLLAA